MPANQHVFTPSDSFPPNVDYWRGQLELGSAGLLHWQFVLHLKRKQRSAFVRRMFPGAHVEATRSIAALDYVFKEDTYVMDTRFEFGQKPINRSSDRDWENIWTLAKTGNIEEIPPDIRFRCYRTIKDIKKDYSVPKFIERQGIVYYGPTHTGKSHRCWAEAGIEDTYIKNPRTKFWDGYRGQKHVIIDEFRGNIDISYILTWLDRYPCRIEIKGGAVDFQAEKIWITSNLHPEEWYPGLDSETKEALLRRVSVERMDTRFLLGGGSV